MTEALDSIQRGLDQAQVKGGTRRQFVGASAAALGGMGLMGVLPSSASAADPTNDTQTVLNVAATAEVLATIVNTVGFESRLGLDRVTRRNIKAAAQEELRHYDVLVGLGGTPATKRIWVPNEVFSSAESLLNTLVVGDQIFVNAYLIGVGAFAKLDPKLAAVPAEFMGAEAVHRALALQSLGELGNDRIFMKVEFFHVLEAVDRLQVAGFGFGGPGARPDHFSDFDDVR
ncbi:MAG: twin-arginine translocation signal domain-containing protein, partial [Solirubrobacteraceae bacterium]